MEQNGAVLIGLFIFSITVLWAIRIVYGPKRSEDRVRRTLTLGALALSMIAVIGMMMSLLSSFVGVNVGVTLLLTFVTMIVLALSRHQYFESERRSYIWTLSHAIERDLPLVKVAEAFRNDRIFMSQCDRVTSRLASGSSLPEAMRAADFPLNVDVFLAIHVSRLTKQLGAALKAFTVENEEIDSLMRVMFTRLCYFLALMVYWSLFTSFMMIKIVPVYERMFMDFGMQLPPASEWLIAIASRYSTGLGLILFPTICFSCIGLVIALMRSLDFLGRDVPILGRLGSQLDRSRVMKSLALSVAASREIHRAIEFLSENYPKGYVRAKLTRAKKMVAMGQHWPETLYQVNLISAADMTVLKAAERAGNLNWALREIADNQARRFIYHLRWIQSVVFPIVTLLFGLVAALVVIGLFHPLITLISGLT